MEKNEERLKMEMYVTDILHEFGVPAHLNGYRYLRCAIMKLVENMELAHTITKGLYFDTAKECGSTVNKVERSIRNAIEISWQRGNTEAFDKYFGYSSSNGKSRPCNSEYMVQIADRVRLELKGAPAL